MENKENKVIRQASHLHFNYVEFLFFSLFVPFVVDY